MRELEGQTMSDVSGEAAGMQAGSNGGLFLLVKPREMAVKTVKRVMLFILVVRRSGSRGAKRALMIE